MIKEGRCFFSQKEGVSFFLKAFFLRGGQAYQRKRFPSAGQIERNLICRKNLGALPTYISKNLGTCEGTGFEWAFRISI